MRYVGKKERAGKGGKKRAGGGVENLDDDRRQPNARSAPSGPRGVLLRGLHDRESLARCNLYAGGVLCREKPEDKWKEFRRKDAHSRAPERGNTSCPTP